MQGKLHVRVHVHGMEGERNKGGREGGKGERGGEGIGRWRLRQGEGGGQTKRQWDGRTV